MTLTELKSAVLRELRVLALGEDANATHTDIVGDKYTSLYDMLLTKGLVSWTATGDIPDYAAQPVTMMLAYLASGPLGVSPQRRAELEQQGALDLPQVKGGPSVAERQLRVQLARNYVPHAMKSDYY